MQKNGTDFLYSPTDLTIFVASPFASWMARFALEHKDAMPPEDAPDGLFNVSGGRAGDDHMARAFACATDYFRHRHDSNRRTTVARSSTTPFAEDPHG